MNRLVSIAPQKNSVHAVRGKYSGAFPLFAYLFKMNSEVITGNRISY